MERNLYIGGSGAATIVGTNEHGTRLRYWMEKGPNGKKPDLDGNRHVMRGNFMEPMVRDYIRTYVDPTAGTLQNYVRFDNDVREAREVAEKEASFAFDVGQAEIARARLKRNAGEEIFLLDREWLSPVNGVPFVGGHPDDIGDEILWEYKAPTMYRFDKILREGLPSAWFYQVQHYLMLTGMGRGAVAIWDYNRWEPYIFYFDADPNLHAIMREEYERFWESVERGSPPPHLTPRQKQHWDVISDDDLDALLAEHCAAKQAYYDAQDAKDRAKGKILTYAQGREVLQTLNHVCRIKFVETKRSSYYVVNVSKNEPEELDGSEAGED